MFLNLKYINDEFIVDIKKLWMCKITKTEIRFYLKNSREDTKYIYIKRTELLNEVFDILVVKVKEFFTKMGNLLFITKMDVCYYLDIKQINSYVFKEIPLSKFPEKFTRTINIGLYNGYILTLYYSSEEEDYKDAKMTNKYIKNVLTSYHKKDKKVKKIMEI